MPRNFFGALVIALLAIFASIGYAEVVSADGPLDLQIQVYGLPPTVEAGKTYNVILSAGNSKGVATKEEVSLTSEGAIKDAAGKDIASVTLDANGIGTFQVSFSKAGPATLRAIVGKDSVSTYRVKAGDTLDSIAASNGDSPALLYQRNQGTIGDNQVVSQGQVLSLMARAQVATWSVNVTGGGSAAAGGSSYNASIKGIPADVKAGSTLKPQVIVTDLTNKAASGVEITIAGAGKGSAKTDANGTVSMDVIAPEKTGSTTLVFDVAGMKVVYPINVIPGDVDKASVTAGDNGSFTVTATDKFGNPVTGNLPITVSVGGKTATTTVTSSANPQVQAVGKNTAPNVQGGGIPAVAATQGKVVAYKVVPGDNLWNLWTSMGRPGSSWTQWRNATMQANNLTHNSMGIVVVNPNQILSIPSF